MRSKASQHCQTRPRRRDLERECAADRLGRRDANNSRGAARARCLAEGCRPTPGPRALPATLAHDIAAVRADVPRAATAASSQEGARPFQRVVTRRWAIGLVGRYRRSRHHLLVTVHVKVWRDGASSARSRRQVDVAVAGCRGMRFVSGGRPHREAVDARRRSRAHLRGGQIVLASRRCPTACTLLSAWGNGESGCTTSTGRSSTPSRGTDSVWSVAATPDGQHIISSG